MSEYIIDMGNSSYKSSSGLLCADVSQLRGEIVRCRDCKHYIYGECMAEDGNGDYLRLTVPPSHFCAWGEKAVQ